MKKKVVSLMLVAAMAATMMVGCGTKEPAATGGMYLSVLR